MKIYAAYGSNMNLKQMKNRCPGAKVIGKGILKDYKLGFRGNGHANIEVNTGSEVPIVLWEVTPECEIALDRYEGHPSYYVKEDVLVQTEQGGTKATAYVMTDAYEGIITEPTDGYYNIICQGYLDNDIPLESLEEALKEVKPYI